MQDLGSVSDFNSAFTTALGDSLVIYDGRPNPIRCLKSKVSHDDDCRNREMDVVTQGDDEWLRALSIVVFGDRVFGGRRIG